jgi:hypothetical protein
MDAAFMQFQRHDRGIHVVKIWYGRFHGTVVIAAPRDAPARQDANPTYGAGDPAATGDT